MCGLHMHHRGMTHFFFPSSFCILLSHYYVHLRFLRLFTACVCSLQHVPASGVEGMGTDSSIYRSIRARRLRTVRAGLCSRSILTSVTLAVLRSPAAEEGVHYCLSVFMRTDLCVFFSMLHSGDPNMHFTGKVGTF